jgi:hypothetical protein
MCGEEQKRGGARKSEAVAGVRKRRSGEGGGRRGQGGLQHEALTDAPCSPRVGGRELASANARGQSGSLGIARVEALGSKHTARGAFFPPVASRRLRPHRRALATSSTLTILQRGDAKRALCNERCTRGACSGGPTAASAVLLARRDLFAGRGVDGNPSSDALHCSETVPSSSMPPLPRTFRPSRRHLALTIGW